MEGETLININNYNKLGELRIYVRDGAFGIGFAYLRGEMSYVNGNIQGLSGYAYQAVQNSTNQVPEQKSEGSLIHRVMVRLGLVVDPASIAAKKTLDNFHAKQPLNRKSELGLNGLENGGRHSANRATDAQLLDTLANVDG
jgi:hypothetical protein